MYRWKSFAAALLLLALLSSCSAGSSEELFTSETVPRLILTPAGASSPDDGWICSVSGNYSWHYPSGKDEYTHQEAIGPEPTHILTFSDTPHIELDTAVTVKLTWEGRQPDTVRMCGCWDTAVFSRDEHESDADHILDAAVIDETPDGYTMTLQPGAVYDIFASWPAVQGQSFGDAHFYIVTGQ